VNRSDLDRELRSIQHGGFEVDPAPRSLTAATVRVAERHARIAELHPDIRADLDRMGRRAVDVIDPSPGLWGGDPVQGLVTVVYACSCRHFPDLERLHTHHALYGPRDEEAGGPPVLYAD
jgi:hypothetical protein